MHLAEDTLLELLQNDAEDEHLDGCLDCREKLETFRLVADALADEATWDGTPLHTAPVPETIANLRGFADRMAAEDAEAAAYLPDLMFGPREGWMDNLRRHPEYRTAGMVRKLLEAVPTARDLMPRDAVELTALAIEIAEHLEDGTPQLRGAAWRERAYALFYTGDFVAAERALCASESHFNESVASEYDLARVGIVRAVVEQGLEKYSSGITQARESAQQFRLYSDQSKEAAARIAEANLLSTCGQHEQAYSLLISLKNELLERGDVATYARVTANLGIYCWKARRLDEALQSFDLAAQLLEDLGNHSDAVRTKWNAARVFTGEGRFNDALPRLRMVVREFERLGMMAAATQASLEIAEILVTNGAFDEVEEICRMAIQRFETSHLTYTAPALTALALMLEAVKNRTATKKQISHVREYLRRVPDEPHLLFAFPAE